MQRDSVHVGFGVTPADLGSNRPFPLNPGADGQRLALSAWYLLGPDAEGDYVQVQTSVVELLCDIDDEDSSLLHVDYQRDKQDYPESHLQVYATSTYWEVASARSLDRLHLPVGGRRYRPSIEDVLEFLLCEGMSTGREGWEEAIGEHREDFRRTQLRAAVRRDPETAREAVEEFDRRLEESRKSKRRST